MKNIDHNSIPLISIIIPAYNVENYIARTLTSVLEQSDNDFELIVINDGSTDKTLEITTNLLKNYNINYKIIDKKNGGVSLARNIGIKEANGEYICFVDSDDLISNNLIKTVKNEIKKNPDFICWEYKIISDKINKISEYDNKNYKIDIFYEKEMFLKELLIYKSFNISVWSAVYKKSIIIENNLYFSENFINGEDGEFLFKYIVHCDKIIRLNSVLYYYRIRYNSITKQKFNIRHYDAFYAYCNVIDYYKNINISNEIILSLNIEALNHYLSWFGIHSAYFSLLSYNKLKKEIKKQYKNIINDINEIKKLIYINKKFLKKMSLKKQIRIRIFHLSPFLYYYISHFFYGIVRYLKYNRLFIKY